MQRRFGDLAKLSILFFLVPAFAQAACSADGYTAVFINGVFDTEDDAKAESRALQDTLGSEYKSEPVLVLTGYNQTHLAGAGDLIESVFPTFDQYDLNTILLQLHPEIATQKVLLVGHSQGTVYANSMYDYLISHGESKGSVAVYNVATPASFVAGDGKYLTSSGDTAINSIRGKLGFNPLPANIDFTSSIADALTGFPGHSFVGAYLAEAPDRMVADMQTELGALSAASSSPRIDCFEPPQQTLGYRVQGAAFSIADPAAQTIRTGSVDAYRGGVLALTAASSAVHASYAAVGGVLGKVASALSDQVVNPAAPENAPKNFDIVKSLYGSSVGQDEVKDLLNDQTQGASVALALSPPPQTAQAEPTSTGLVLGEETAPATTTASSTQADEATTTPTPVHLPYPPPISLGGVTVKPEPEPEATSTASTTTAVVLFTASTTPPVLSVAACSGSLSSSFCLVPASSATVSWSAPDGAVEYHLLVNGADIQTTTATSAVISLANNASTTVTVAAYDASSTAATSTEQSVFFVAQPVVINEIAWAGTQSSADDQWIELKNLTPYQIDASRLALYAADGGSQYVPLSGTIPAFDLSQFPHAGFYLIERGSQVLTSVSPDLIAQFDSLAASGEEIVLASVGFATTTLDRTPPIAACNGWCAGALSAVIGSSTVEGILPNTLSMERISTTTSGALASNWGSNDTYTIYGKDSAGTRVLGSPLGENSLQQPEAGWFCDPDTRSIVSGSAYRPQSGNCTYLARFIGFSAASAGGLYRGVIGSSTLVSGGSPHFLGRPGQTGRVADDAITGAAAGDPFFVALWEPDVFSFPNPNYSANFNSYFTTGAQLDGSSTTPHQLYRTIPFTYGP